MHRIILDHTAPIKLPTIEDQYVVTISKASMKITNGGLRPGSIPDVISQLPSQSTPSPPIDVESILSSSKSKLVLHFDINETILIGDEAGGDSVEDCLNKVWYNLKYLSYFYYILYFFLAHNY